MAVFFSVSLIFNICLVVWLLFLFIYRQICGELKGDSIRKDPIITLPPLLFSKRPWAKKSHRDNDNLPSSGIHQRRQSSFEVLPTQFNSIVFLGDSLIQTCEWSELIGSLNSKNRGIAGDTIDMVLGRLTPIIKAQPLQLLLMVGVNDLRHKNCDIDATLKRYESLLKRINQDSPNTQVLVHSILPIHLEMFKERFRKDGQHINQNVTEFNQLLNEMVVDVGAQYINLIPLLTDSSGQLRPKYTVDGIHLSGDAYRVWVQYLKPFLLDIDEPYDARQLKQMSENGERIAGKGMIVN